MWRARWDTGGTHTFETERPATDAPKSKELDGGGRDSDPNLCMGREKAHSNSTREVGDARTETCRVATLSPSDPTRDAIDLWEAS